MGLIFTSARQLDRDFLAFFDDVVVRHDEAGGIDDKARTHGLRALRLPLASLTALTALALALAKLTEEIAERRRNVVQAGHLLAGRFPFHHDGDHRRADVFDEIG